MSTVSINFVQLDGAVVSVDAEVGQSLMRAAVDHGVNDVDAECGGACSCATCHVHIRPEWRELAGPVTPMETAMLEFAEGVDDGSRLSCQVLVQAGMAGMTVEVGEHE